MDLRKGSLNPFYTAILTLVIKQDTADK